MAKTVILEDPPAPFAGKTPPGTEVRTYAPVELTDQDRRQIMADIEAGTITVTDLRLTSRR